MYTSNGHWISKKKKKNISGPHCCSSSLTSICSQVQQARQFEEARVWVMEGKEDMKCRPFNYLRPGFHYIVTNATQLRGRGLMLPRAGVLKWSEPGGEKPWRQFTYTVCKSLLLQREQANIHSLIYTSGLIWTRMLINLSLHLLTLFILTFS